MVTGLQHSTTPVARAAPSSLGTTIRVVRALLLREARTRYGRHRMGYAWALIEPTIQVAVIAGIWALLGRTSHAGVDMVPLIVAGVVCAQMFSNTTSRMSGALNANRSLLLYPPVKPADPLLARAILEACTSVLVLMFLLSIGVVLGYRVPISDPLLALWALICGFVFAMGCGFLVASLSRLTPIADRALNFVNRFTFYTSGVFFTLSMLPAHAAETLSWLPTAQVVEALRGGLFDGPGVGRHADPVYLGWAAIIALGIGLVAHRTVDDLPTHRLAGPGGI